MSRPDPQAPILGIHHVTAIAGDPQANLDFYAGTLGLRLVKKTVNFDDPQTYHFYFGDRQGHPGTLLTFFPWAGARRGRHGAGQATAAALAVPPESLGYWGERLARHGVDIDTGSRFGSEVLRFSDPDGLRLELVERDDLDAWEAWTQSGVPRQHAIHGVDSVTLTEADAGRTASFLADLLGFRPSAEADGRRRFEVGDGGTGARVDLLARPGAGFGHIAAGTVHHVAFRLAGDPEQAVWQRHLAAGGVSVTPVQDRNYFHSVYFREPGGVLFELATDPPGFTVDEPLAALGTQLRLPPPLEPARERLEKLLAPVTVPGQAPVLAAIAAR